jgi:hypothetical protein
MDTTELMGGHPGLKDFVVCSTDPDPLLKPLPITYLFSATHTSQAVAYNIFAWFGCCFISTLRIRPMWEGTLFGSLL